MDFSTSFAGTLYQNQEAKRAAKRQMEFQERMSSTAYQRAMADMRKAGLNPMLAMKLGGASTPTGAMYNPQNVGAAAVEGAQKGAQRRMANAQVQTQTATAKGLEIENKIKQRTLDDLEKRGITIGDIQNKWQNLAGSEVYKALTKELPPAELAEWLMQVMQGNYSGATDVLKRNSNQSKKREKLMKLNKGAHDMIRKGLDRFNEKVQRGPLVKRHFTERDHIFKWSYDKYKYYKNRREGSN
jgi:hypothetical protein